MKFASIASIAVLALLSLPARAQSPTGVPAEQELKQLVNRTILKFNDAVQTRRFDRFRERGMSGRFMRDVTAKQMLQEFDPFIQNEIDLTDGLRASDIIFDEEPHLGADKVLRVVGFYPTEPIRIVFDLAFINEVGEWRLHGITVGLKKFSGGTAGAAGGVRQQIAGDDTHKELVRKTLVDFSVAVKRRDFTAFHAKAATQMKRQMTSAKLKEVFDEWLTEQTDISGVAKEEIRFDEPPTIQSGLVLTLKGHTRAEQLFVLFDVDYFKEQGQWKLLSLNLKTLTPGEFKTGRVAESAEPTPDKSENESTPRPAEDGAAPAEQMEK